MELSQEQYLIMDAQYLWVESALTVGISKDELIALIKKFKVKLKPTMEEFDYDREQLISYLMLRSEQVKLVEAIDQILKEAYPYLLNWKEFESLYHERRSDSKASLIQFFEHIKRDNSKITSLDLALINERPILIWRLIFDELFEQTRDELAKKNILHFKSPYFPNA